MNKIISQISDIRFGFYAQPTDNGKVSYLQARHFDNDGILIQQPDEFVLLDKKSENHLLQDGDILFVGKGNRLFAACYKPSFGPCIASSIFFVIRPNLSQVVPEYLVTILNTEQSKATFQQLALGSNIFSIRKSEIGAFEIPLPSINKQKIIANLSSLHAEEIVLMNEIVQQKKILFKEVITNLIKN